MATWVEPVDSQTDPDAPLTSALAKRWDNNLIAMAEGAPGAPRVDISAMGPAYIDAISLTVPGGQNTYTDLILPFKCNSFRMFLYLMHTGSSSDNTKALSLRFSDDLGVTWSPMVHMLTARRGSSASGAYTVSDSEYLIESNATIGSFPSFPPGGVNAIRLQSSTVSGTSFESRLRLAVHLLAGS